MTFGGSSDIYVIFHAKQEDEVFNTHPAAGTQAKRTLLFFCAKFEQEVKAVSVLCRSKVGSFCDKYTNIQKFALLGMLYLIKNTIKIIL